MIALAMFWTHSFQKYNHCIKDNYFIIITKLYNSYKTLIKVIMMYVRSKQRYLGGKKLEKQAFKNSIESYHCFVSLLMVVNEI